MDDNCQKIKLLKIVEIMRNETDVLHPITTNAFCQRLISMNITCDRRTLARDMALLNGEGYPVYSCMRGHEKAYYMECSRFTTAEIKLLMDAVQAAGFITERKTGELIDKLAELGGDSRAELLKSNLVNFNTRKHTNEAVFDNIAIIEDALQSKKKISFQYFDLNDRGRKVFRKEGKVYTVIPAALVYNEDYYYLICYNRSYKSTTNYRVDRMANMQITDISVDEDTLMELRELDIAEYTREVFKMYAGIASSVQLRFDDSLIGAVYDKFGEKIRMSRIDDHICEVKTKVQISPTFFGWVFQFGSKMEIVSPNRVAGQFKALAASLVCRENEQENMPEKDDENAPF